MLIAETNETKAERYRDVKYLFKAIEHYQSAFVIQQDLDILFNRARVHLMITDFHVDPLTKFKHVMESIHVCQQLIEKDSSKPDVFHHLGQSFTTLSEMQLDPDTLYELEKLNQMTFEKNDFQNWLNLAIENYKKSLFIIDSLIFTLASSSSSFMNDQPTEMDSNEKENEKIRLEQEQRETLYALASAKCILMTSSSSSLANGFNENFIKEVISYYESILKDLPSPPSETNEQENQIEYILNALEIHTSFLSSLTNTDQLEGKSNDHDGIQLLLFDQPAINFAERSIMSLLGELQKFPKSAQLYCEQGDAFATLYSFYRHHHWWTQLVQQKQQQQEAKNDNSRKDIYFQESVDAYQQALKFYQRPQIYQSLADVYMEYYLDFLKLEKDTVQQNQMLEKQQGNMNDHKQLLCMKWYEYQLKSCQFKPQEHNTRLYTHFKKLCKVVLSATHMDPNFLNVVKMSDMNNDNNIDVVIGNKNDELVWLEMKRILESQELKIDKHSLMSLMKDNFHQEMILLGGWF